MNKCNCCDGIYNSFDIHFTSLCDNKCKHCVDLCYKGKGLHKPNVEAIVNTIIANKDSIDEVPEWYDGNTLIIDDEWVAYVEEMLKDIGYITRDFPWWIEIDCEKTAENVAVDYSTVEYKGHTYYYRSC